MVEFFVLLFIYVTGILGYIHTNTEELDENFKWHCVESTPRIARRSLIWPVLLLWSLLVGFFNFIKCMYNFVLLLIGKSKGV